MHLTCATDTSSIREVCCFCGCFVDVVVFAVLVVILAAVHILLTNEIHFVSMEVSNAITDMLIKNFLKDCGIY